MTSLARSRGLEGGLDGGLEHVVGDVFGAAAVDEEGGRAGHAELLAVDEVALDLLGEAAVLERRVELRAVEPEHLRVLLELLGLQGRLVAEEDRGEVPVLALLARGLGGLGGLARLRMLLEREVADDKADAVAVLR